MHHLGGLFYISASTRFDPTGDPSMTLQKALVASRAEASVNEGEELGYLSW